MAKVPLSDSEFSRLLQEIKFETSSNEKKFNILYYSKGCFSGVQTASLLHAFKTSTERVKIIKVLQKRLCRMSCAEAREILICMPLTHDDRLIALDCIKRTLVDHQTLEGLEYILSAFVFEKDKVTAMNIMTTINAYVLHEVPSGGHQGYAPLGGLYTQSFPLKEHFYGPTYRQCALSDTTTNRNFNAPEIRSKINHQVSFAYNGDAGRTWYPGGGKPPLPPAPTDNTVSGRPLRLGEPRREPLASCPTFSNDNPSSGLHQSAPVPVGFSDITPARLNDSCCNILGCSYPTDKVSFVNSN